MFSCYNPNKLGCLFSVKFVFVLFTVHCIFDEFPSQRLWHERLRRPSIEPVRRHDVPDTFGSRESRDFRTRKNPSVNRFSLAVNLCCRISLYQFTKARGADYFKRTSKPHKLCSIRSRKIRLPEGFLYDTTLLTYSV